LNLRCKLLCRSPRAWDETLYSITGSMSSVVINNGRRVQLPFWGVLSCSPTPVVSCAAPSYSTSLCPSSFLVQLCTPCFPSPRVVRPGVPPAETNKLLTNVNIRALRSTGRSYAISTTRSIVIDHVLPPHVSATSAKKVPGSTNCSMYGAITRGRGKFGKNAKNRIRALIFYSDRKITQLIATKQLSDLPFTPTTAKPALIQRAQTSRLINMMVPDTTPSPSIPLSECKPGSPNEIAEFIPRN
jgi:hypothetical protein